MRYFPAEWHKQSAIQLTWPHSSTDWKDNLNEVIEVYVQIIKQIQSDQKVLVVTQNPQEVRQSVKKMDNVCLIKCELTDTWARDHGGISVFDNKQPVLLDFGFNAWGNKFDFEKDNAITKTMFDQKVFDKDVVYMDYLNFIMEGGSLESDGKGTVLTTSQCLLSPERNAGMTREQIENELKSRLGAQRVLWLDHGYLAGDDTDSHIDTLARFVKDSTIVYVACENENDEHYQALKAMETELKEFKQANGQPYRLVALPMADPVYEDKDRLPATYANFLITNNKILLPFYGSSKDQEVKAIFQKLFEDKEVVGINCLPLIKQHGSLHCITMQYPEGFVK